MGVVTGLRGIVTGQWGRGAVGQCTLAFRRAETGAHTDLPIVENSVSGGPGDVW